MTDSAHNGWSEYQKLVLATMAKNSERIERLLEVVHALRESNSVEHEAIKGETNALKIKAGIWGAIAGAFPSLVVVLILLLKG